MLFNSLEFITIFLPLTLLAWWGLKFWFGIRIAITWLVCASLYFYAAWDVRYLGVLLSSVTINYWIAGRILNATEKKSEQRAKSWLVTGIIFNLLVLGGFKYAYFIFENLFSLFSLPAPFAPFALPLAISFVTFQKLAYLVDCKRGVVQNHNALDYLFFVSFFPQLIAGPIVHHRPLIMQTVDVQNPLFRSANILPLGLTFFAMGLFKKVVLADSLARYASPVFELARTGVPSLENAWQGMLAYTLQLYFDFSAYSDMAIGLALLFGFKLPINFSSPYKSQSMIEFWRRWHITLSNFLRDYLYIPLGGSRFGALRHYRNLWLTMLLAGLWHGAGWNYILWGALHGTMLLTNHFWISLMRQVSLIGKIGRAIPRALYVAITFIAVALAWVLFRSADIATASRFYAGLFGNGGSGILAHPPWHSVGAMLEGFFAATPEMAWVWIGLGISVVMLAPNTARMLSYDPTHNVPIKNQLGIGIGLLAGSSLWLALKWMAVRPATEFLYFNF